MRALPGVSDVSTSIPEKKWRADESLGLEPSNVPGIKAGRISFSNFLVHPLFAPFVPEMPANNQKQVNNRMRVDQWNGRHPNWAATVDFTASGPENARLFTYTYTLGGTTPIVGDPKSNKGDAKEDAATKAWPICELWEKQGRVSSLLQLSLTV